MSEAQNAFLQTLKTEIDAHCREVVDTFQRLSAAELSQPPQPQAWSVLQCFDHLNLTHDYYAPKLAAALAEPTQGGNAYHPSFWGRIYMHFALNPRFSFSTATAITPQAQPDRIVLDAYLSRQEALEAILDQAAGIDLVRTRVPIEAFVRFNLGDCLKVLVYHDKLHIGQAHRALAQLRSQPQS